MAERVKKDAVERMDRAMNPSHYGIGSDVEELDPTPVELPAGATAPPTMSEMIARVVHAKLESQEQEGYDSPEEADDFEEEDPDYLDMTAYEEHLIVTEEDVLEGLPEAPEAEIETEAHPEPPSEEESRTEDSGS